MNSVDAQQFSIVVQSMIIGIAILWLMADYIGKFGGLVRFLLSMAIIVFIACFEILSYSTIFSDEMVLLLALFVFITFAMLAAITLSKRMCGKKYSQVRFMWWLALWTLVFIILAALGLFVVTGLIIPSSWPSNFLSVLSEIAVVGLIFGLFIYVLNLPFMILGFVNPFFRERFLTCLRLKSMPSTVDSSQNTVQLDGKNQGV